ncbi:alpha/beta hydrolase [uncultured Ruminococcus sp.]|uniref:alpha/beta hydrolase n=1 Tax=uncultured Ruminococcus sp. TaxID=165186 RepID=UPI0025937788|nr:alpha/beta hydrolase-fold protein [uncultured Ruminococcus sp.]
MRIANEALQTGEYEVLPAGSIDATDQSLYASNQNADYRNVWEYDRDAVEKIKDSIDEINIYDEELDVDFLVHVTLPPDYDNSKTYPVFFLTDGVWRFGNCTELRSVMENGEAAPVILVSLGYDYNIDGTDNDNRITYFIQKGSMLLDFITDNLMPYLGENYSIDYTNSTLYGHSNGGVFTHEALFQSDLYENQPFGNYIIGSPAFWNLYHEELGVDPEDYSNDYGYFDRNDTLDKKVFLCGGTLEDSDYSEYYNGHDTTLEGLEKLNQRLESHNADVTYQLYHTHHYQYIPEMLTAYLKQTYPVT